MVVHRNEHGTDEIELSVRSDLDEMTVAEFRKALYAELDEPQKHIRLDLENVHNVSSSALGAMLLFQKKARESGKDISICKCNPDLRKILLAIRFDRTFPMDGETPPGSQA
jgi:anti-anti-sigma factor